MPDLLTVKEGARILPRTGENPAKKAALRELGCSFYAFFFVPQVNNTLSVL